MNKIILFTIFIINILAVRPVVIFPGFGGSVLKSKAGDVAHFYCKRDWHVSWVVLADFIPGETSCYNAELTLQWDDYNQKMINATDIEVISPDFGSTWSVETLDHEPLINYAADYFMKFIKTLKNDYGYTDNDIYACNYDWRVFQNEQWYEDCANLIQEVSSNHSGEAVYAVTHSMGGMMSTILFEKKGKSFVDKYIYKWVTINCPWIGSVALLETISSGKLNMLPIISFKNFLDALRSFESSFLLLPHPNLWNQSKVIATLGGASYTSANISQLFANIGAGYYGQTIQKKAVSALNYQNTIRPWQEDLIHECIYGDGYDTPERLDYTKTDLSKFDLTSGAGDGLVNWESLIYCKNFKTANPHYVGQTQHFLMMDNQGTVDEILGIMVDK